MTNFEKNVNAFINELQGFTKMDNVFNPWADYDKKHDKNGDMPKERRENLEQYLLKREKAEYLLIAEAPGYQGCHFSGIPMTSERLILTKNNYDLQDLNRTSDNTKLSKEKIYTEKYSNGRNIAKTVIKNGFAEPTATTVWKQMIDILKIEPNNFALWNAFPFHPYNKYGYLSNRKPTEEEIKDTVKILENFINLFEYKKKIICIGNIANNTVETLKNKKNNISCDVFNVRHPSYGGAKEFRKKLSDIFTIDNVKA